MILTSLSTVCEGEKGIMKHVGIVACSAEGAALCYRTFCVEAESVVGVPWHHPEVSVHTHSLAEYMDGIVGGDWEKVAALMLDSARKLAAAGAELLICPDNTIHQAMPRVLPHSPLPWLHIADAVADYAEKQEWHTLGLIGTRYLMEGPVYRSVLAPRRLSVMVPGPDEREEIDRIIFEELVRGRFTDAARNRFNRIIAGLQRRGCEAVILGCTEIPLLVRPEESPLPVLDSTRLLARAAIKASTAA